MRNATGGGGTARAGRRARRRASDSRTRSTRWPPASAARRKAAAGSSASPKQQQRRVTRSVQREALGIREPSLQGTWARWPEGGETWHVRVPGRVWQPGDVDELAGPANAKTAAGRMLHAARTAARRAVLDQAPDVYRRHMAGLDEAGLSLHGGGWLPGGGNPLAAVGLGGAVYASPVVAALLGAAGSPRLGGAAATAGSRRRWPGRRPRAPRAIPRSPCGGGPPPGRSSSRGRRARRRARRGCRPG